MSAAQESARHPQLLDRLRAALGPEAQLVSVRQADPQRLRGLAVCSGRILSFVLEAEQNRLRTQPLFELLQQRRPG
jgi:Tfp pilus assembly protein PilN